MFRTTVTVFISFIPPLLSCAILLKSSKEKKTLYSKSILTNLMSKKSSICGTILAQFHLTVLFPKTKPNSRPSKKKWSSCQPKNCNSCLLERRVESKRSTGLARFVSGTFRNTKMRHLLLLNTTKFVR